MAAFSHFLNPRGFADQYMICNQRRVSIVGYIADSAICQWHVEGAGRVDILTNLSESSFETHTDLIVLCHFLD